jgi:sterol desaturase/sphingolipid hydroxylase (fatty acid hydroxylase superfamily)
VTVPDDPPVWFAAGKAAATVAGFVLLWSWESFWPLTADRPHRWRHAGRNMAVAVVNTVLLGVLFGAATVAMTLWAARHRSGLLHQLDLPGPGRWLLALLLLDGWLYVWHRLNHAVPLLWRFHRMHHADPEMDVTTATRFHPGEQIASATLRLGLIPLLGVTMAEILVYETLVIAVTMFHHANISLGPADRPLRWLLVTPRMHQIHHSRWRPETNSNYAVVLSLWDRLGRTFRRRSGPQPVELGLDGFDDDRWQTVAGMLRTPLAEESPVTPE